MFIFHEIFDNPEEESEVLFRLDQDRFQNILRENDWFKLKYDFKAENNPLSQSFLIWQEIRPGDLELWFLIDFENQKSYYINALGEREQPTTDVKVSEFPYPDEKLKDLKVIRTLLQPEPGIRSDPQGTRIGFIDFLTKIDLDEVNLEGLKRSDLSGSSLDFEGVHQDLVVVHEFFREILASSSTSHTILSDTTVQTVRSYLLQFYEIEEEIKTFNVSGANPTEKHAKLLQRISNFYSEARSVLEPIIAYVRSMQSGYLSVKTSHSDSANPIQQIFRAIVPNK